MKKQNQNDDILQQGAEEETNYNEETVEEFVELDSEGEELSGKDQMKKLREKIKKLEGEKQEYLNSWQRALADYKNREMQIEKDKKEWGGYAEKRFAEDLLVVMDTYDAARSNREAWESVDSNWRSGIEYIFQTFENKLKDHGFEKFGNIGEVFDPNVHEGLGVIDLSEANTGENLEYKDGKIAQIITSGYKYKGEVWRAAKVKVWKK